MKNSCVVLILAGGNSSRMKFPKTYLEMGGGTFVKRITDAYIEAGFTNIRLVINSIFCSAKWQPFLEKLHSNIQVIPNYLPEKGRLFSIQTGLTEESKADFCFVTNVDNPLITANIINILWDKRSMEATVIPTFKGQGGHPVLIPSKIIKEIRNNEPENNTLKDLLNLFPRTYIDTNAESVLLNINTPEEYNKLCSTHLLSLK